MSQEIRPHMTITLTLLAFGLFQSASATATSASNDACAALIPSALVARIAADWPAYQLPVSSDAGEARGKALDVSGDWPCPFVIVADFDGNGTLDRALLLKPRQPGTARLLGALNNNGQWQITLSEDWPLTLSDSQLSPKEAGLYQREEAIKQPAAQLDQLASLQSDYAGFTAGKLNGLYALYALINGKWQKLTFNEQ
jgi:hypothetical protein